jgi:hypothetical protein
VVAGFSFFRSQKQIEKRPYFVEVSRYWVFFHVEFTNYLYFWSKIAEIYLKGRAFSGSFCYICRTAPKIQTTLSANRRVKTGEFLR